MNEADMEHGHDWQGEDLAGWTVTEKLDGCRAFWDGTTLWLRSGRVVQLPSGLRATMPATPADGELWAGRGGFQLASRAARFGVFAPAVQFVAFATLPVTTLRDTAHALELFAAIKAGGGEGLMARRPGTVPTVGRSRNLLKVKAFRP